MSTSQKMEAFIRESMKDAATGQYKDCDACGGVGPAAKAKLDAAGYTKAYHLLGQFLSFSMDEDMFVDWVKTEAGMNGNHADMCYRSLKDWCQNNL